MKIYKSIPFMLFLYLSLIQTDLIFSDENALPDEALARLQDQIHPQPIRTFTLLPQNQLVTADIKGNVLLWDWKKRKQLKKIAVVNRGVPELASSSDGSLLAAACYDGHIRVWEMKTGKEKYTILAHKRAPLSVSFSPDGRTLASGGERGGIRLWDISTGKEIRKWDSPKGSDWINALAFSHDGSMLAATHVRAITHVWDVKTGKKNTINENSAQ